jgi:lysophospholipase L1-like esterase
MQKLVLIVGLWALAEIPAVAAEKLYVAGDSIGSGIAEAAHLQSVARTGASAAALAKQLQQVPSGSTVIVSIGTNDAIGGHASAKLPDRPDLNLVYVGPPCVQTKWSATQRKFAAFLAAHTRHIALPCLTSARSKDGVHFTAEGYAKLWATIRKGL